MSTLFGKYNLASFLSCSFLLVLVISQLVVMLHLNEGKLVYTLDDPYIHMAMAENIRSGHYGVNISEYSSPSSSIIWPFILAIAPEFEFFPLFLNILFALLTVLIFSIILKLSLVFTDKSLEFYLHLFFLFSLILMTNMTGLIFTGMEHSLQVLIVSMTALGLIIAMKKDRVEPWFVFAIVFSPMVRYENLAISLPAIMYLIHKRHNAKAIISIASILVVMIGFSLFLIHLGLDAMPSSVNVKSALVGSSSRLYSIASGVRNNITHRQGIALAAGLIVLLSFSLYSSGEKRVLSTIASVSILMHFFAGRFGWLNRYEIFVWTFTLLVIISLCGDFLPKLFTDRRTTIKSFIVLSCIVFFSSADYIMGLAFLPLASNNIYEQQYQMHRFAVDYYDKPVAVNDLGYVSYKNDNHVLDLWGLASHEAIELRHKSSDIEWMNQLAQKKNIGLAMIYQEWFPEVPDNWILTGKLILGRKRISPAHGTVAFYALNPDAYNEILPALRSFKDDIPKTSTLLIFGHDSRLEN